MKTNPQEIEKFRGKRPSTKTEENLDKALTEMGLLKGGQIELPMEPTKLKQLEKDFTEFLNNASYHTIHALSRHRGIETLSKPGKDNIGDAFAKMTDPNKFGIMLLNRKVHDNLRDVFNAIEIPQTKNGKYSEEDLEKREHIHEMVKAGALSSSTSMEDRLSSVLSKLQLGTNNTKELEEQIHQGAKKDELLQKKQQQQNAKREQLLEKQKEERSFKGPSVDPNAGELTSDQLTQQLLKQLRQNESNGNTVVTEQPVKKPVTIESFAQGLGGDNTSSVTHADVSELLNEKGGGEKLAKALGTGKALQTYWDMEKRGEIKPPGDKQKRLAAILPHLDKEQLQNCMKNERFVRLISDPKFGFPQTAAKHLDATQLGVIAKCPKTPLQIGAVTELLKHLTPENTNNVGGKFHAIASGGFPGEVHLNKELSGPLNRLSDEFEIRVNALPKDLNLQKQTFKINDQKMNVNEFSNALLNRFKTLTTAQSMNYKPNVKETVGPKTGIGF